MKSPLILSAFESTNIEYGYVIAYILITMPTIRLLPLFVILADDEMEEHDHRIVSGDCKFSVTEALRPIVKSYTGPPRNMHASSPRVSLRGRLQVTSEVSTDQCVARIQTARLDRDLPHFATKSPHVTYPVDYTNRRDPRRNRDVQSRQFPGTIYGQPIHQSAPCSVRGDRIRNDLLGLS